jgi:hypothetical protein
MTFALFDIENGVLINRYDTELSARIGLREANGNAGWTRISRSWIDGYECEYCTNGKIESYGPYAITEHDRWEEKINPHYYKRAS